MCPSALSMGLQYTGISAWPRTNPVSAGHMNALAFSGMDAAVAKQCGPIAGSVQSALFAANFV